MTVTERHDCQPPSAESIGQIWTCPVCGDAWRVEEGAPIGGELRCGGDFRCLTGAPDRLRASPLVSARAAT
jgi:hypothetical protein